MFFIKATADMSIRPETYGFAESRAALDRQGLLDPGFLHCVVWLGHLPPELAYRASRRNPKSQGLKHPK